MKLGITIKVEIRVEIRLRYRELVKNTLEFRFNPDFFFFLGGWGMG